MHPPRYMEFIYAFALFSSVGRLVVIAMFVHSIQCSVCYENPAAAEATDDHKG
jgi:hypothetical protein